MGKKKTKVQPQEKGGKDDKVSAEKDGWLLTTSYRVDGFRAAGWLNGESLSEVFIQILFRMLYRIRRMSLIRRP